MTKLDLMKLSLNSLAQITLAAVFLLCSASQVQAQFDTEFWMPPIWNTGQSGHNTPSELFITTPSPTPVNVHIETGDGTTWTFDGTVVSGSPLQVDLTPILAQTDTPNVVDLTRGLIVTSSQAIQCVHKISGQFNQTLVTLKGRNARGRDFWAGSQVRNMNATYSPDEYHFISVMALEDNTTITFETPFDMFQVGAGNLPNPYTITLNARESYLIRGNNPIEHVAGSHVTSDKDIVVNSGSTHTRIAGGNAADGGSDQLVPIGLMGQEFVVVKGDNTGIFDYAIVVATENNTQVFLDGNASPVATLNAGEVYDYTLAGSMGSPHLLQTNKTAYCYHFTGASQDDEVGMSAIPQVECTGSRYIEFSKFQVNTINQVMNLTVPAEAVSTLTVNGVPYNNVPGAIINNVPGKPGWIAVALPNASLNDNNIITSEGFFHAGFLTGNGGATGTYGYLSGFNDAFEFLDPFTMLPTTIYTVGSLCQGESIDHCLLVFSCADDHNIINVEGNIGNVTVTPPTTPFDTCFTYTAPFNHVGGDTLTLTVENRFGFTGQIDVVFVVLDPNTPIDAGEMQELCGGITNGVLSAVNPDPLVTGTWSLVSGSGTIINPNNPTTPVTGLGLGANVFEWSLDYGCEVVSDNTTIMVYDGAVPDANAGPDAELCSNANTYTMQANNPGTTATGTWEILQGTATIFNINSNTALVTNLGIGENIFQWNLDNGPCDGNVKTDEMSIFVFDANHPAANAGSDQEFCSNGFTSAALSANTPIFPATGMWSVVSGSGTFADPNEPNTTVSNLSIGENVFQWSIDNGPCSNNPLTDTVTITLYDSSVAVANAGSDAQICTPTTSYTLEAVDPVGPGFGTWSVTSGSATFSNPQAANALASNLSFGENILRFTIDNGPCATTGSFDEVVITVFDNNHPPAAAGEDQQICVNDPADALVTLEAVATAFPATGAWSVISGGATVTEPNNPNSTVTNLSMGTNVLQWTVNNGPCGAPTSDQITVTLFGDDIDATYAGEDVSFCTPTSTYIMQAEPAPFPAVGQWTLVSGTGTISNVNDPNASISGLGIGANVYRWSILNGPCPGNSIFDEVTIFIYDENAPAANAGPNQSFCEDPVSPITVNLAANATIFPGTGTWSVVSGSGTFANANSNTTTVTNLAVGENIFAWTIDNGPCAPGVSTDQVSIFVFSASQTPADAGANQLLCSDNPTTTLQGNAVTFPAVGTWTLQSGQGTIADPNNPNTEVTNLGVGANIFVYTVQNGPCGEPTSDQMTITVFEGALSPANAGMDQVVCSSTPVVTLAGNQPTLPATGEWTLVSGSATITNPNLFNTTVSNLGVGDNVLQWTVENGPCSGFTSDQVTITVHNAALPAANAGVDQQLCLPQTSTTLAGSATPYPAIGTWQVVSGTGVFADANDPNSAVTGLSVGQNTFRWTVTNGPCPPASTLDLVSIFVFDNTQTVSAGADQSFCTPVSAATLAGTAPIFPATGQWTLVSGSGNITNPTAATTGVTGLTVGENVFQYTISNGPCAPGSLVDTVVISIFDNDQADANAGPDQQICSPSTTTTLAGNAAIFPATGLWTVVSGSAILDNPTDPNTSVSGLGVGTVVLEWTINNGACNPTTTSDQVTLQLFDSAAPTALAGADQQLCLPSNSTALQGNTPTLPGTGVWTLVSGSGNIASPSNPTSNVTGLGIGNNVFQWTINNGACGGISSDQVVIAVFTPNAPVANAGEDQFLCTPDNFTALQGNTPQIPGTGAWTLVSGSGDIVNPTSPTSAIENLAIGENIFQWTINNGPCGNTSDQVSIFVFDGGAPQANAGPDQILCTPLNSTTMAASPALDPGVGTWTLVSGSGVIAEPNNPNSAITGLGIGINIFAWTLDYSTCGVQEDFVSIVLYDSSIAPANAGADQELCTPLDATNLTATAVALPAIGTWTLLSGSGDIQNANNANTEVTNLALGENIFVWTVFNGNCLATEDRTDTVSVFVFNADLAAADAGPNQSLCTPNVSTTLAGSPLSGPATGVWTLVSGGGTLVDPTSATSAVTGLPVGENVFQWTIDNGNCANAITSDVVSIFVFDENQPAANAGADQELCTPVASINLAANAAIFPAVGTWTLISGSGSIANVNDPNTLVTGLTPGENIFRWRIQNGPCGAFTQDFVSIFIYDQFNAAADAGDDQELCFPITEAVLNGNTPNDPAIGVWTLVSGAGSISNINNPNATVTGLGLGENIFVWTVNNGPCPNGITTDTVSIFVFDPATPVAAAGDDQFLCTPLTSTTLAANDVLFPAVGTWSLVQGSGSIADINNPNTEVSGLGIGVNIFEWTIYNGSCAGSGSSDQIAITVYDETQASANAGVDQQLCSPQEATVLAANAVVFPATGSWTLVQGSATIVDVNNPNSPLIGIGLGTTVLQWTVNNGVCANASTSDLVEISLFAFDAETANAGEDQEFCFPTTQTTLEANATTGAAIGSWQVVSGTGTFADANDANTAVSDLSIGENVFAWVIDNGPCGLSTDEVTIRIFDPEAPVAAAGEDQFMCTPVSTTVLNGNTPATPGTGTWTLISGMGTINDVNDPNTALSGLTIGENVFAWTIYNGPCAEPTVDVVSIFVYDENHPDAQAGLDQELCLPQNTTVLNATPAIFPAFGTWSLLEGSGSIGDVNDPNSFVSGLTLGANTFVWTINNAPCDFALNPDTVTIFIFEEDIIPALAGNDQLFCSPVAESELNAAPLNSPNTGTWELLSGTGSIDSPFDPTTTISGLTVGENVFVWTVYNGPCEQALSSDTVSVFIFDENQEPADAGVDQELCLPVNSTFLEANAPIFPATGFWQVLSGSGTIADATAPFTQVTDLGAGTNVFQWTISNGPCEDAITTDTVNILVFTEDAAAANAGPDIDVCTPVSEVTLQAVAPTEPGTGTWSIVSGSGSISNINDPNAVLSGLPTGTHVLQWTVYNGPCLNNNTFDFITVTVFDATSEPADAGPSQEICAPDDQVQLNAVAPIFPASGTWSVISGSGSISDVTDPQATISGLSIGTTVLSWSVSNGPCEEPSSAITTITIYNPDSPDAAAGEDQEFCTPFGGAVLAANAPLQPAVGTWTLISGAGEITNVNAPNSTVFNLGLGENIFVWSIYNGPCANGLTTDTVSIFVNDLSVAAADAGMDQDLCGAPLELQLQGSETIGNTATGTWTVLEGGADFENVNNEATYISNLQPGVNTFLWTVDNGFCGVTSDEVTLVVFDPELPSAFAGTDLEVCEDDFNIFNLPASEAEFPATGVWTVLEGPIDIGDLTDPNSTVWSLGSIQSPLTPVVSTIVWTVDNGPCGASADTVSFTLLDCLTLEIPDAFSPNGDGINDVFEIPNLFKYDNNSIKIFNRWGALIYEAAPYKNDWDGRSQHPATIGEELPVSTYYFILDLGEPNIPVYNGFIYLKR